MSLSIEHQQLIGRISAMSAEQFNACIAARAEYQSALDAWTEYQDEVPFVIDDPDPLADADMLLEVLDEEFLDHVRQKMRAALAKVKKTHRKNADADGLRQDIFTEAFSESLKADLLSTHGVSEEMYADISVMDEEVYQGRLDWSLVTGAGKNLDMAVHTTRHG